MSSIATVFVTVMPETSRVAEGIGAFSMSPIKSSSLGLGRGNQPLLDFAAFFDLQPAPDPAVIPTELRRMHGTGDYTITDLAELFNISRPTVYRTLAAVETVAAQRSRR